MACHRRRHRIGISASKLSSSSGQSSVVHTTQPTKLPPTSICHSFIARDHQFIIVSMEQSIQCHYDVLSVARDADAATIKKAHRKLALRVSFYAQQTSSVDARIKQHALTLFFSACSFIQIRILATTRQWISFD